MRSATIDQPRAMEQSFRALWLLYGIVPIVAGADKFVGLLANWEGYLSPAMREVLPVSPTTFMHAVGIIEIVAGILVFALPRVETASQSVVVSNTRYGSLCLFDVTGIAFEIGAVEVGADHCRTFTAKQVDGGLADTRPGARDDGHFSGKTRHYSPTPIVLPPSTIIVWPVMKVEAGEAR